MAKGLVELEQEEAGLVQQIEELVAKLNSVRAEYQDKLQRLTANREAQTARLRAQLAELGSSKPAEAPQRRRRRTKAEMEADRAAKAEAGLELKAAE